MRERGWIAVVAVGAYCVFWLAVLFGYLRLDPHDVSDAVYQTVRGAAVVLPAFVLGFVVGRRWAVLAGLVFLLAAALPAREVFTGDAEIDTGRVGSDGSRTSVLEINPPPEKQAGEIIEDEDTDETVQRIVSWLEERKLLA